jgi:hypothetical protein
VSKIIPYETLARQQHLSFLRHQASQYREREDYLSRLRRLLFQVEGQMRQAEIQQLDAFRRVAEHFQLTLPFPDLGDRLGLQRFFATNPFLLVLREFFAARLSEEECYRKIMELKGEADPGARED